MNNEIDKEKLEKLLHSIAQEAKPDKNFEQMLQHKLKMRFAAKYSTDNNDNEKSGSFWSGLLKFKLQVSSALVLVLFSSTTIYAYNSDGVTNGHILYPLKRSVEKVEEIFISSPEEKTGYYNRMAERRIRELDYLEAHGRFDEETVIEADALLSRAEIAAASIVNGNIKVGNNRTENSSIELDTAENNEDNKEETSEIRSRNLEPVKNNTNPDGERKNRDEDTKSIIIKPNLEIRTEQEISAETTILEEIPEKSPTRKESAVFEVKQTRSRLKAKLEAHLEKNPNAGARLENLEQKFKVIEEKSGEKSRIKIREKIIEIDKPEITDQEAPREDNSNDKGTKDDNSSNEKPDTEIFNPETKETAVDTDNSVDSSTDSKTLKADSPETAPIPTNDTGINATTDANSKTSTNQAGDSDEEEPKIFSIPTFEPIR